MRKNPHDLPVQGADPKPTEVSESFSIHFQDPKCYALNSLQNHLDGFHLNQISNRP